MPVVYVDGDVFDEPCQALAHGVNLAGAMSRGIAARFKREFRDMFLVYCRWCREGVVPGDVFRWVAPGRIVYNVGTQAHWRSRATLAAIERGLETTVRLAQQDAVRRVALPWIGCGLGGLDRAVVRPVLERVGAATDVVLVVCSL